MVAVGPGTFCTSHRAGCLLHTVCCCCLLLLWSPEMDGLSDFSNYLFRIINSHSARARDGQVMLLSCPRHSTISMRSAFYGHHGPPSDCTAPTALQKMLSECQGRRSCQVLVHHRLFGEDPCPDTLKHLYVSYSCKPTEHRNRTRCEGDLMLLHCKYPKLLNIYSAVYGREPEQREVCPTVEEERPPPYECSYHGALDAVRSECYGKQRCLLTVDDQHFRNPCPPGATKYLRVLYSCVPQTLFKQADPDFFKTTPIPHETTEAEDQPQVKDSRLPEQRAVIVSNSLMAFVFIKEHPEMAGLLFISSVCLGLLVVLLAISTRLTCTGRPKALNCLRNTKADEKPDTEDEEDDTSDEDEDESEPLMDRSLMSERGGKVYFWEDVGYTTEAAELMERLERRDLIIQEIRMNAYLNGNSYALR